MKRSGGLFWKAAFAFLVLPGTVAFLIPLMVFAPARGEREFDVLALIPSSLFPLVVFALAMLVVFHTRVVFGEEPWLARTHGDRWLAYRERVPRWLAPRRRFD